MATANSEITKQVKLDDDFFDDLFGEDAPDTKSFFIDDEDGDFKVGKPAISPKTQNDDEDEEDASGKVADTSDSAAEEKTETSEPSALEKRVSSIESSVNKLIDLFEKQANTKQTQQVEEEDEEEFDFNPKSFRKMIQDEIKGALKPLQQTQAEQTQKDLLTKDYHTIAAKYGDDFTRLGKAIEKIATQSLLSDPTRTNVFEDAYKQAKEYETMFNPAKSDSTKQPEARPKKTIEANKLKEKVQALATQEGVSKTGGKKAVKISNVREAFDETLEELFGSAGFND